MHLLWLGNIAMKPRSKNYCILYLVETISFIAHRCTVVGLSHWMWCNKQKPQYQRPHTLLKMLVPTYGYGSKNLYPLFTINNHCFSYCCLSLSPISWVSILTHGHITHTFHWQCSTLLRVSTTGVPSNLRNFHRQIRNTRLALGLAVWPPVRIGLSHVKGAGIQTSTEWMQLI